jgi:hypothetical protein
MVSSLLLGATALLAAVSARADSYPNSGNATNPVVNLGAAGSYMGVIQNNGTYVLSLPAHQH